VGSNTAGLVNTRPPTLLGVACPKSNNDLLGCKKSGVAVMLRRFCVEFSLEALPLVTLRLIGDAFAAEPSPPLPPGLNHGLEPDNMMRPVAK
jgi:hypothetical protein